jgi:predicted RNA-binding Zn-ribbon protein involved in translation (DUF1610 family)
MQTDENEMELLEFNFRCNREIQTRSVIRGCPKCGEKGIFVRNDGLRTYACGYSSFCQIDGSAKETPCIKMLF